MIWVLKSVYLGQIIEQLNKCIIIKFRNRNKNIKYDPVAQAPFKKNIDLV